MADLKNFAEQLVNLTVKEVNELAQILKEEYGIEPAAAAVAVAAGPAAGIAPPVAPACRSCGGAVRVMKEAAGSAETGGRESFGTSAHRGGVS
mgnify:CR=1 FL=1